jgi:hypothetical protein
MLLKSADNKEAQTTILKNLLNHPTISAVKKKEIEKELRNFNIGVATEKQAAYEIDFYFGPAKNMMVLHDIRIEINGRVAQIDHLLINRLCEVYVLETKTFGSGLSINDRGEFSTTYDGREVGIASPIEQSARHVAVLRDAFKSIGLPKRLGLTIQPSFHPVVLVSQKAVINRPQKSNIDLDRIIKIDQFFTWFNKQVDDTKLSDTIGILKFCSRETIQKLGEGLVALHKPGRIDYIRKFDLTSSLLKNEGAAPPQPSPIQPAVSSHDAIQHTDRYFCAACQTTITNVVAKFCWNNKSRFGGKAYCRPCQGNF